MSNKALLLSIKPRFAQLIFSGLKTVELRKRRPRIQKGDSVFVYVSSPVKALEGAFELEDVVSDTPVVIWRRYGQSTGISKTEFERYFEGRSVAFALIIARSWKLVSPIKLSKLRKQHRGFHPPQGYHYIQHSRFG